MDYELLTRAELYQLYDKALMAMCEDEVTDDMFVEVQLIELEIFKRFGAEIVPF
jgi:hypothetical protein